MDTDAEVVMRLQMNVDRAYLRRLDAAREGHLNSYLKARSQESYYRAALENLLGIVEPNG